MNKQPVLYLQTNPQWYETGFQTSTGRIRIGPGGCGPTCCAMLISTLTGKEVLPTETMEWACKNGYVLAGYGIVSANYFPAQFRKYNLSCDVLWSWSRKQVEADLQAGYYFIAGMGKGNWTNYGHFVVVWWEDNKVRINDPASTREDRMNGDPSLFWNQVKTFYRVDARAYNNPKKEDELDMTIDEFINNVTPEQVSKLADKIPDKDIGRLALKIDKGTLLTLYNIAMNQLAKAGPSPYAEEACKLAIESKVFKDGDGDNLLDMPQCPLTREQYVETMRRQGLFPMPGPQESGGN